MWPLFRFPQWPYLAKLKDHNENDDDDALHQSCDVSQVYLYSFVCACAFICIQFNRMRGVVYTPPQTKHNSITRRTAHETFL